MPSPATEQLLLDFIRESRARFKADGERRQRDDARMARLDRLAEEAQAASVAARNASIEARDATRRFIEVVEDLRTELHNHHEALADQIRIEVARQVDEHLPIATT